MTSQLVHVMVAGLYYFIETGSVPITAYQREHQFDTSLV
jgi:hypothetical protein